MIDSRSEIDEFINKTFLFFKENKNVEGSNFLKRLHDDLFVCLFLYDCILKGIKIHEKLLFERIKEISRKVMPEEVSKIEKDFRKIVSHKDLISILSYEFFLNYLVSIIDVGLDSKLNLLKDLGEIKYQAYEIVDKIINNPSLLLKELKNILLFGSKNRGNVRTDPNFWKKILEKFKINLSSNSIAFWEAFHVRRNASSHLDAQDRWLEIETNINSRDIRIWIYGLFYLAYEIDLEFQKQIELSLEHIDISLDGEPFYKLEKFDFNLIV